MQEDNIDIEELRQRISSLKESIESGEREVAEGKLYRVESESNRLNECIGNPSQNPAIPIEDTAEDRRWSRTPEGRKLEAEKTVAWFKNYNSLRVALQDLLGAFNVLARQESGSRKEQLLVVTSKIANIRQQFTGAQIEAGVAFWHGRLQIADGAAEDGRTIADPAPATMLTAKALGQELKRRRKVKKLDPEKLAVLVLSAASGVSNVRRWEAGTQLPREKTTYAIAKELGWPEFPELVEALRTQTHANARKRDGT